MTAEPAERRHDRASLAWDYADGEGRRVCRLSAATDGARLSLDTGNLSAEILPRETGTITHFLIVTHWASHDTIIAFADEDIARANYYPEDSDFLIEFEPTVEHYAVAVKQSREYVIRGGTR